MRTALLLPLFASVVSTTAFAWGKSVEGSGEIVSETRALARVTRVEAQGGMKVDIQVGTPSLKIETDKNLLALVETTVRDGTLVIAPKDHAQLRPSTFIKVTVSVPSLTGVSASGGVAMNVDVPLTKNVAIDASGGVTLRAGKIDADALSLEVSGGVEMSLGGKADAATVELSGGVDVRAKGLSVKTMKLDASGGCQFETSVSETLRGDISGGVDLDVYGAPKVEVSKSGGASVDLHR